MRLIRPIRPILFFLSAVLAAGALIAVYSFFFSKPAQAAWFDSNWSFRQAIPVSAHTSAETNVYISVTVDTSSTTNFQAHCEDVRFTQQDGKLLSYYLFTDNCRSGNSVFHVLLPTFPAGAQTIYVYFGNPSASRGTVATDFSTQASNYTVGTLAAQENGSGPLLYWSFDDGQSTVAQDKSSSKNNGTVSNATWITEDQCVSGKCLKFVGTSSAKVTTSTTINNVQTISFWVNPKSTTESIIDFDGGTHKITVASGVVTATGFSGTVVIYVNGNASTTLSASTWQLVEITTTTSFNATSFKVGYDNTTYFNGFMDGVKLYNYVRAAAQVKLDYNSRAAAAAKGSGTIMGATNQDYLSNGLVGYWKMDEASWTVNCATGSVTDSTSNGNNMTACPNSSGPAGGAAGKFGYAGYFDGSNDYLATANPPSTALSLTTNFTVSLWFYYSGTGTAGKAYWTLIDKNNDSSGWNDIFHLWVNSSNYYLESRVGNGTNNQLDLTTSTAVNDSKWHLATLTRAGTAIALYLDGQLKSSGTLTGSPTHNNNISLGFWSAYGDYFKGYMDDVRVYNRALSPIEVSNLYNWAPGPMGYWNFEEGAGTSVKDTSGDGFTGTWAGTGTTHWTSGKYGTAGNFNGSDDQVNVGSISTQLNLISTTPPSFTIEAWFKPGAGQSLGGIQLCNSQCRLLYRSDAKKFNIQLKAGSTAAWSGVITEGTWYYVAGVYDKDAAKLKIYLNGALIDSQTPADTDISASAMNMLIGNAQQYYKGVIDDVRIFNYARTAKQIVSDMNAGHPVVGSPVGSAVGYWDFDEGYGTGTAGAHNSGNAGSALDGTLSGSTVPSWTNSGKFGKALSFNGTSAYVAMPSDASALKITSDLTLSAWINLSDTSSQHDIVCKYTGTASTSAYCLYTNTSGQLVMAVVNTTGPAIVTTTETAQTLAASTWYHVVGVLNTTLGQVNLYVNGVQVKQNTSSIPTTLQNPTTVLDIGAENAGSNLFKGTIDEPKVYNYALTSDEVKTEYNRGQSMVLGAAGNNSSYQPQAENQEYCIPGDASTCSAPVGRWDFEEGTGTTSYDTSGNGYNGTITGATYKSGKYGKALNFNGGTDAVGSISSIAGIKTVSFWVYPSSTTANLIDLQTTPSTINVSASSGTISATGFTSPTYYINGVQTTSPTLTVNTWNHIEITTGTAITGSAVRFGRISTTSLIGKLDAIRFYNYARSAAQVAWDYNRGAPVGWWKFDECQGTTAHDSSGNNNSGTITIGGTGTQTAVGTCTTSGTAWGNGATGKRNYSLNFDGTDDYVSIPDQTYLSPGAGNYTMSAWIKTTKNYSSAIGWIFSNYGSNTSNVTQLVINTDNKLLCGFRDGSNNLAQAKNTGQVLNDGNWYHVVCMRNGTTAYEYVNGVQIGSATNASLGTIDTTGAAKAIGAIATDHSQLFNGQIDDVRIYNYALTATQVKDAYNGGALFFGPSTGNP